MFSRFLGCLLAIAGLVALGVILGLGFLAIPTVRHHLNLAPDAPNPLGELLEPTPLPEQPEITPVEQMEWARNSNRFTRPSWQANEHGARPRDPRTDPRRGTTETMFFQTALEVKLSTALREARLPNKILKIGIRRVHSSAVGSTASSIVKHGVPAADAQRGPCFCYIEVYSGMPVSRPAIEETVDRAIELTFRTVPEVVEVDVVAVPWRTVRAYRPPAYFSVTAERVAYLPVAGVRSHMENLRTCGAVWVDAKVMPDLEVSNQR